MGNGGLTTVESVADLSFYGVDSVTGCSNRVERSGRARWFGEQGFDDVFICTSESCSG
jgi:hypothetical protein